MDIEHTIKVLPITPELAQQVAQLEKEGWEAMPGVVPLAVYHLVRVKAAAQTPASGGLGTLTVDDSRVQVISGPKSN